MGRASKSARRRASHKPPLRMRPKAPLNDGGDYDAADACVTCGAVQRDKFDSTLMCSMGHATCFACVAAGVQPHVLCGYACNGFKYLCGGCSVWLCINKTQELALMCGGHALARTRLDEEAIEPQDFDTQEADAQSSSWSSSRSSNASDDDGSSSSTSCPCGGGGLPSDGGGGGGGGERELQLPRVCHVDWSKGQDQRIRRLERLRASLLGL